MTHEQYNKAAQYWEIKDAANKVMEGHSLLKAIEDYIKKNNTCALATGSGTFIRCTPIEYMYYEGAFWLLSEGGEKFIGLENNKNVCLAIFDSYEGFSNLKGMQITGEASIVDASEVEYQIALEKKGIPQAVWNQMRERLHLIKIVPKHIDFLNSEFKKNGEESRQAIDM